MTLPPGAYTVQLPGVGGTTGEGVVAVYEMPEVFAARKPYGLTAVPSRRRTGSQ